MKKLLLLYSTIYNFVAETFIQGLNDANGDDILVRVNSPGGSVFAGWGMIDAIKSYDGNIKVKVDGVAASMAFFMLLFCDDVECADTSKFMVHRAWGYAETDEDKQLLNEVNSQLKAKMTKKFDADIFESVAGITIEDLFKEDKNIWLDAKQAKKLGIVNKINRLEPSEQQAFSKLVACGNFEEAFATEIKEDEKEINWENIANAFKS